MTVKYSLIGDENGQTLTVIFSDGEVATVPAVHGGFKAVLNYILTTEDDDVDETWIKENLDIILKAGTQLTQLSERVSLVGNRLLFDGDEINQSIADHILRLVSDSDEDGWKPLVLFLEKVQTNPSEASRESLYSWLIDREFTISGDGDFIAYKGVQVGDNGESLSINHGEAFVDGVVHRGAIPNPNGSVISMPRSGVNANVGIGCSTGLHAGTWDYAHSFARGRVLTVAINPRDVVSVPSDCNFQKLRVSRYTVLEETDVAYTTPTWFAPTDDDFLEDDEDGWGHDDGENDESESATWEDSWKHDEEGRLREIFDVEIWESPEEIIEYLMEDREWGRDIATAVVYGTLEVDDDGLLLSEPEDDGPELDDTIAPVVQSSWFTRYSGGNPTP